MRKVLGEGITMLKFKKMHGAGNDFILIRHIEDGYDYQTLAKKVCNRNFGIGADGLMVASESNIADIKMNYFNSDGSIGEMCGNGIRCFSKFVYEEGIVCDTKFSVETLAGIKHVVLTKYDDVVETVKVSMGHVDFEPKHIPVETKKDRFIKQLISIQGKDVELSTVLMGVPHTVIISEKLDKNELLELGPKIEKYPLFLKGTNVNFVEIVDHSTIKVDTWERGAGNTLACGTGACASAFIARELKGLGDVIKAILPGGILTIYIEGTEIFMEGPAVNIAVGEFID